MAKALNVKGNTVSAKDDAFLYHMISGKNGVFNYGNKMDFQTVSANLIRIKDGMAQIQGRNYIIYPSETVDVAVESGTQGSKRNDIIVIEFTKTSSDETMEIKCIKGNPSTGNVTDPQIIQQDTLSSGTKYQLPLYRVKLNGINIEGVDDLRVYISSIDTIAKEISCHGSLLINSDFQINQRGQSIYDYSNEPKKYCLDMWYVTKMKVEILENGCIKVTNNDTTRHAILQDIDKVIGKHILCVYVEEKTGEASEKNSFQLVYFKNNQQINGKSFNNETGLIYEVVDYEINKVGVIVPSNCTITLKFIKLFEGDILYKCQKEEHTIALMRCYQYVFSTTQKRLVGKVGTAHLEGFDFPIRMKSTPLYTVIEFESTNGNDLKNELEGISATSRGVVYMALQNPTQQEYQYTILFSCEPL